MARRRRSTLFVVLLSGFYALLRAATGQIDLVVGVQVANRVAPELRDVIGCFFNQLPFRAEVGGNLSIDELLERIDETAKEAYAHQQLPLEKLIQILKSAKSPLIDFPLFPVWFQVLTYEGVKSTNVDGLAIEPFDFDPGIAPAELEVNWWDGEEELACTFNFDTSLFSDATIDRLMLRYQAILEITARNPGLRLSQL